MADWYVSSVAWAAVAVWQASHAYTLGAIIRATAPAADNQHCFVCTTAGTSGATQPTWVLTTNGTSSTTSGTAHFTLQTGNATNNWAAPAGKITALLGQGGASSGAVINSGDRVFVSSDHTETNAEQIIYSPIGAGAPLTYWYSVNRSSGHIPPQAGDIVQGAALYCTTGYLIVEYGRFEGFVLKADSFILFCNGSLMTVYLKNCKLILTAAASGISFNNASRAVLENVTMQFGATSQSIGGANYPTALEWFGTASAIVGATLPTNLFVMTGNSGGVVSLRGVDLSALGSGCTLFEFGGTQSAPARIALEACKLGASVTITDLVAAASGTVAQGNVELYNCDSGSTNYRNERYTNLGSVTTETTITLSGGASDGVQAFSRKMVTNAFPVIIEPLECFAIDVWNSLTGSSHTATLEFISSGSLTNQDIFMRLEYLGTSGFPISSFVTDLPNPLSSASARTSSSATWNASPSTPVAQNIALAFTAQKAGWVRAIVYLAKPSTTVYVNPQLSIV